MTEPGLGANFVLDLGPRIDAQDPLPEHQEDFQRLVKLLRYAPGFQLLFVRVADLPYRHRLIAALAELLADTQRQEIAADLADRQRFPDFAALENWLEADERRQAVVHLLNGEAWLQGSNLEAFNLRRNAMAEHLGSALVWWLPAAALERVARNAPDVWSWRGGVFDFIASRDSAELFSPPRESTPTPVLDLAQREQRLAVLTQQLAGDVPEEFRIELLLEQAELLESIGRWEEAMQVLSAEVLPLTEKLGEVRLKVVTQGKIADILQTRGELDDALRIRREVELPVYERLDDVRAKAVTQGKIADILQARGELDEALRIYHDDELPVYEWLGDVREKSITQVKIAHIREARGELDEALRILREDVLPVYERLGDVRSMAVTQSKIADILQGRGELDEVLRIHREEVMPVLERLGDMREKAVTQGKIADILQARGELDEALALHSQRLPVAQRMKDIDSIAHIEFSMARIRLARGDHKQGGLETIKEELSHAFAISAKMDRPDFIAVIGGLLAQVQAMSGQKAEALKTLGLAETAYRKLGNENALAQIEHLRRSISATS